MRNKKFILLLFCNLAFATDNLQQQLITIAMQEARIANIGSNKAMMLYGKQDVIRTINHWNQLQQRSALSELQIAQIQQLETEKHNLLQQGKK